MPSANMLFQSMAPGIMMSPVANAAPPVSPDLAQVQSARESLYSRLGVNIPSGLNGPDAFMSYRGLEAEGPVMNFSNAEIEFAS